MVIPNIGAFIAWGLITALFIPTGWLKELGADWDWIDDISGATVGPMITYLLPLLIAYTGGKLIHGHRGGVLEPSPLWVLSVVHPSNSRSALT